MTYGKIKIAIIEDSPDDTELMMRVLRQYNLDEGVIVLKDGAEALDFVVRREQFSDWNVNELPRVILLDLKLPKVDGIEVLRRIKAEKRTKHIPVVILTSSSEERDLKAAYALGANSYVAKPIRFDEFSNRIKEIVTYWVALNSTSAALETRM